MGDATRSATADGRALAASIDRLNVLLRQAEEEFVALGLGVGATVSLGEHGSLVFGKSGSDWGLFVVREKAPGERVPLLQSSRLERIAAARSLDVIEDAIFGNAEQMARDLAEAIGAAEKFLADDAPYVCPGCHAVAEPCAPDCIDDEIAREREEAIACGDYDRMSDDEEEVQRG